MSVTVASSTPSCRGDVSRGARRAAILLSCLDPETAQAVLNQLPPEHVEALRTLEPTVQEVGRDEVQEVLERYLQQRNRNGPQAPGVAQGDVQPGPISAGTVAAEPVAPRCQEPLSSTPIPPHVPKQDEDARRSGVIEQITAELLADEHPQTIAVVLARLPAQRAMEIIARLQPALQAEVLQRFVEFNGLGPGGRELIQDTLNGWIDQQLSAAAQRAELVARVERFLEQADAPTRATIVASLQKADSRLARHLRPASAEAPIGTRNPSPATADPAPRPDADTAIGRG